MRERKLLQGCLRKGSGIMEELASELLKELNCDTAFSIKLPAGLPLIGGVQLDIAESVVITWVVMAVILILSIILTSNLKVHNVSRRQLVAETIVTKLEGIVTGMIGEEGKRYVPYLVSVLLYLGISNIIGLFGMKPPTKDLNVTAALALMSIILVEAAGIRKKGVGGPVGGKAYHYQQNASSSKQTKKTSSNVPTEAEIDVILDKLKRSGYGALTEEEKATLFRASGKK